MSYLKVIKGVNEKSFPLKKKDRDNINGSRQSDDDEEIGEGGNKTGREKQKEGHEGCGRNWSLDNCHKSKVNVLLGHENGNSGRGCDNGRGVGNTEIAVF